MKTPRAILWLLLLCTLGFTLGVCLQPRTWNWKQNHAASGGAMKLLFGESRRLFANQFFVQADVAFHSGYYPSIFDQARMEEEKDNDVAHPGSQDESAATTKPQQAAIGAGRELEAGGFLGKPADWIERFGRHFMVSEHTHLHGKSAREILPWLKFSADLDPHRIETYLVTAYWLERMHQPNEAVQFVREGLRENPRNPALLYELGILYFKNLQQPERARTVWLAARRCWHELEAPKPRPDKHVLDEILGGLVRIAEKSNRPEEALDYLKELKTVSPNPDAIQRLIDETQAKLSGAPNPASTR